MNTSNKIKYILNFKSSFWLFLPLSFCIFLLLFLTGFYPTVRFSEEQIDIEVYPDHVWVEGQYVYKNPFPFSVIQGLALPLPVDSDYPEPILLSVKKLSPAKGSIPLRYIFGMHRFDLLFKAFHGRRFKCR